MDCAGNWWPTPARESDMTSDLFFQKPMRAEVTEAWLAGNQAKRLAYEEQRRRHTRPWHGKDEPEPEPEDPGPGTGVGTRKPSRGKIHDKRQGSFDV